VAAAVAGGIIIAWFVIRAISGGKIEPGLLKGRIDQIPNWPLGVVLSEKLPLRREVIGSIQSRVPIDAASRVAARVTGVMVRAGDRVHRGQVLVTLDASELRAQIAQAQGELAAARGELSRATADQKRFSALFARGSVTASEHDAAEAAYRNAAGRFAQAQAAVAAAQAGFAYATIRSPVDGLVVERLAEPGDMAMPGKPLLRLYDENALRVQLEVPEDLARSIQIGTPLDIVVDATGASYHSRVSEIVPASNPLSRSFLVRAPLPSGQHLQPGMFARAALTIGNETILTAPRSAFEQIGQLDTARVISGNRIETRMVSLGRGFGDRVEILAGLAPGERLILKKTDDDSAAGQTVGRSGE
jgi:RND family efflux transporter MFP subunit